MAAEPEPITRLRVIAEGERVNPPYYNVGKIQPIDFIDDQGLNFQLGSAVKYICRCGRKDSADPIEDLQKAITYLHFEIERRKKLEQHTR